MASTSKLRASGFSAWVTCEGESLPVYVAETKGRTTSGWIPSRDAKAFAIKIASTSSEHTVSCKILVDGCLIRTRLIGKACEPITLVDSARISNEEERVLQFAAVQTCEEDTHKLDSVKLAQMGSIVIEFRRVRMVAPSTTPRTESPDPAPFPISSALPKDSSDAKIWEQQKKLSGHRTTLGDAKPRLHKPLATEKIDNAARVIFRFHYRPKEILEAQEIIPWFCPATPTCKTPASVRKRARDERDTSSSTNRSDSVPTTKRLKQDNQGEDVRQPEARLRLLERDLPENKRSVFVKEEGNEFEFSRHFKPSEVIDLTMDD